MNMSKKFVLFLASVCMMLTFAGCEGMVMPITALARYTCPRHSPRAA